MDTKFYTTVQNKMLISLKKEHALRYLQFFSISFLFGKKVNFKFLGSYHP